MDLTYLEALLTLLRKHGVTSYKDQFRELELRFEPAAVEVNAAPPPLEEKPITMEQALFWSSSAPGAGGKP